MRGLSVPLSVRLGRLDPIVVISAAGISVMSILMLFSGVETFGLSKPVVQTFAFITGLAVMVFMSAYDYEEFAKKFWIPLTVLSALLLVFTAFFGSSEGSNSAWIRFGPIGFQPSEFVKIAFIISFARHIDMVKKEINHPKNVLRLLLHGGIVIGAVMLTKDLGSALMFVFIAAAMLFCAGLSLWYFLGIVLIGVISFPFVWPHLAEYQQKRIIVGFNPELDPYDKGYQAIKSRSAIASGGFWGNGWNGGTVYKKLPAASTDFAFSTLLEKFGFIAALLLFVFMSVIVVRIVVLAKNARKDMGAYMCAGICALIIVQTGENVGMCLAMLPVIGITLPFMSYGGSSVLSMYMVMGLAQSIHTHNNKYNFEREST